MEEVTPERESLATTPEQRSHRTMTCAPAEMSAEETGLRLTESKDLVESRGWQVICPLDQYNRSRGLKLDSARLAATGILARGI